MGSGPSAPSGAYHKGLAKRDIRVRERPVRSTGTRAIPLALVARSRSGRRQPIPLPLLQRERPAAAGLSPVKMTVTLWKLVPT